MTRTLFLLVLLGFSFVAPAHAIDSMLTYQGSLEDAGAPATGAYDFQFTLQDSASVQVGMTLSFDNVAVTAGVFTVTLDFGNAAFTGPDRFLVIGVRPGVSTGAYTALAPRTRVTPAPYAQLSDRTNFALSVANNSVGTAQIADTSIGGADINAAQVQARVTGTCPAGSSINAIASAGTVSCEADDAAAALMTFSVPIPTVSINRNAGDNCDTNSSGTFATLDGTGVLLPAGTYLVTVPLLASLNPVVALINNINYLGSANVDTSLRSAGGLLALSFASQGSGSAPGGRTESNTRVFSLSQPTTVFVRSSAALFFCGQVSQAAGRDLTILKIG